MICKNCNFEFDDNFCPMCGAGVDKYNNSENKDNVLPKEKKSNKKKIVTAIAVISGTVLLVVAVILILNNSGIIKNQEEYVREENLIVVSDSFKNIFEPDDDHNKKNEKAKKVLDDLEKQGHINNIKYSEKYLAYAFTYVTGGKGYLVLENDYPEGQWSMKPSVVKNTFYVPSVNKLSISSETKTDLKGLFLFFSNADDVKSKYEFDFITGQIKTYSEAGMNIDFVTDYTIEDFTRLQGYDLIYVMGHGAMPYENDPTPYIATNELITKETVEAYKKINKNDYATVSHGDENSYYLIASSFFENYYENNELKDSIILLTQCGLFGHFGVQNNAFGLSFRNAGASAVFGFFRSVIDLYANTFCDRAIYYLLKGESAGDTYRKVCADLGSDQKVFFDSLAEQNYFENARPVLYGDYYAKLIDESKEVLYPPFGEYIVSVKGRDNKTVKDAYAKVTSGTEEGFGQYSFYFADENGMIDMVLPAGTYLCKIGAHNYDEIEININVEQGVVAVKQDDIILTLKKGELSLTLKDSVTKKVLPDVEVVVSLNESDGFDFTASATSDKNGTINLELDYGSYTVFFNHPDYESYSCSVDINADCVVFENPVLLKKKVADCSDSMALYIPVLEKNLATTPYYYGSGFLYDLDEDNTKELVMLYNTQSDICYSVYDIEDGKVVVKQNNITLTANVAGPDGYVSLVNYSGRPALLTYADNGETGDINGACREAVYKLHETENYDLIATAVLDYVLTDEINANSCMLNGKNCSYEEFLNFIESMQTIITAEIYKNENSDGSMNFYQLISFIQKTEGIISEKTAQVSKAEALQKAEKFWENRLNQDNGTEWKIYEEDSIVKDKTEYYCFTLRENYTMGQWSVSSYLFINSVTGECIQLLYES